MIRVEAAREVEPARWETLLAECGGHPLLYPAIHEAELSPRDRLQLVFYAESHPVACGLAYRRRRRTLRVSWGQGALVLPTPPVIRPERLPEREAIHHALVTFARANGYRELIIQPNWGRSFRGDQEFAGRLSETLIEFVLDPRRSPEDLASDMHKVHRKNIRRAERDGVQVVEDSSLAGLLTLRDMQHVSALRSARKGGGFTVRDQAYFEGVHRRIYAEGLGTLLIARHQGEPVAALAYLHAAGRAITVRSGSTSEGYRLQAMYLLQHAVIEAARRREIQELNLGGVPEEAEREDHPQHGLYDFKKGFGATPQLRTGVRFPLGAA